MIPSIPQLWTKQPQFPAQPRGDGIARGLVLLWNGATPLVAPVAGVPTSLNGGMSPRPFGGHLSPDFNGTSVDVRWNKALTGTNPSEATLFGLCSLDSVATERTIIGMSRSSNTNPLFRIELNGTGFWQAQFRGDGGTAANVSPGGGAPTTNRLYFVVGVFRSGTGLKELWVDGVQVATSSTDVGTITLDQTEIGVLVRSGAAQWWDGVIPIAGIYNRALSTGEILSLTSNPWQLFQPIQRRMVLGASVSGGTQSADASSSGAALATASGASTASANVSATAAAVATASGASIAASNASAIGAATGTLVGAAVSLGFNSGDISSAGTATANGTGASIAASSAAASGVAAGTLEGATSGGVQSAAATGAGTAIATAAGATITAAGMSAAGSATATAVGSDANASTTPTRQDGWLPREVIQLRRKAQDESDLMAIISVLDHDMRMAA